MHPGPLVALAAQACVWRAQPKPRRSVALHRRRGPRPLLSAPERPAPGMEGRGWRVVGW